jgi:uncharacterized protein YecA (UPF0149 family)
MTQPQPQQRSQRLGNHPEFQPFLESLASIPEEKHTQAWQQAYTQLLGKADDWLWLPPHEDMDLL